MPQPANCPWLATGTAARVLGGEVTVATKVENPQSGSCRFVRASGGSRASIDVLAGAADMHACPAGSMKLMAIGNEAVQCRVAPAIGQHADVVAGRIRDIYFVLTVTGVAGIADIDPPDPHLADAHPTSPLERLAEQVVGNLY